MGIELRSLQVEVTAEVDVRGTMMVDKFTPVGFQSIQCDVQMGVSENTDPRLLKHLKSAAAHCCVVQQTLRTPPPVETTMTVSNVKCA